MHRMNERDTMVMTLLLLLQQQQQQQQQQHSFPPPGQPHNNTVPTMSTASSNHHQHHREGGGGRQRPSQSPSLSWQWALTCAVALCLLILDVTMYGVPTNSNNNKEHPTTTTDELVHPPPPRRRLTSTTTTTSTTNKHVEFDATDPHLALFQLSDYTVLGPTHFPEPTRIVQQHLQDQLHHLRNHPTVEVAPLLQPVLGTHRADQDAVFVFASEYDLAVYQGFILSLRKTGFRGDIVLAVSPLDMADPAATTQPPTPRQQKLHAFFASDPHVIIYVVPFVCYNAEGQSTDSAKGGMRVCHCHVLYGSRNITQANPEKNVKYSATEWQPLMDVRASRPVATTRYELYWIWSRQYQPHTWQMLVDARDTYFQSDPFAAVPREPELDRDSGVLFFFGVRLSWMLNSVYVVLLLCIVVLCIMFCLLVLLCLKECAHTTSLSIL